jgi:mannose-1-phosphate guanylyltransferase
VQVRAAFYATCSPSPGVLYDMETGTPFGECTDGPIEPKYGVIRCWNLYHASSSWAGTLRVAKYLASAWFLWNSGMIFFTAGSMLQQMEQCCPQILAATRSSIEPSRPAGGKGLTQLELRLRRRIRYYEI